MTEDDHPCEGKRCIYCGIRRWDFDPAAPDPLKGAVLPRTTKQGARYSKPESGPRLAEESSMLRKAALLLGSATMLVGLIIFATGETGTAIVSLILGALITIYGLGPGRDGLVEKNEDSGAPD